MFRVLILLIVSLFCLVCTNAVAFQATLRSTDTVIAPPRTVEWVVSSNSTTTCFSLDDEACIATVRPYNGGFELRGGATTRLLQGAVIFDENAEFPWNMLWPTVIEKAFEISLQTGDMQIRKAYQLHVNELNRQEASAYGLATDEGRPYIRTQVWRGSDLLSEQVWINGEKLWILDITRTRRTERLTYVP